jgi:hypothetical protein
MGADAPAPIRMTICIMMQLIASKICALLHMKKYTLTSHAYANQVPAYRWA